MMKAALGQFAVSPDWQRNADTCQALMADAARQGAQLLVLPEGVLARDITDPDIVRKAAQPPDGPFVSALLQASRGLPLVTLFCIHTPADIGGKVFNTQLAVQNGRVIAQYRKLHLYDAFAVRESAQVLAGDAMPPLLEVGGLRLGLMTCYDLRFADMARSLALAGAQALAVPAAWVRGPHKERHWELLVCTRALDTTCYVLAAGECGPRNIGQSMVADPLGVAVARAAETPALLLADIDPARIAQARQALPVLQHNRFAPPVLKGAGA